MFSRQVVANMFPAPFFSISSPELWTRFEPDLTDKSSGRTTSCSGRVEPETTGPRDTTLKVPISYLTRTVNTLYTTHVCQSGCYFLLHEVFWEIGGTQTQRIEFETILKSSTLYYVADVIMIKKANKSKAVNLCLHIFQCRAEKLGND